MGGDETQQTQDDESEMSDDLKMMILLFEDDSIPFTHLFFPDDRLR